MLASELLELMKIGDGATTPAWGPTILATLVAFGLGYAVIAWFLTYIATRTFSPFVAYRVAVGALLIGLVAVGALAHRGRWRLTRIRVWAGKVQELLRAVASDGGSGCEGRREPLVVVTALWRRRTLVLVPAGQRARAR